jgi:hypothetical protein
VAKTNLKAKIKMLILAIYYYYLIIIKKKKAFLLSSLSHRFISPPLSFLSPSLFSVHYFDQSGKAVRLSSRRRIQHTLSSSPRSPRSKTSSPMAQIFAVLFNPGCGGE